jgi:hypothetical protein
MTHFPAVPFRRSPTPSRRSYERMTDARALAMAAGAAQRLAAPVAALAPVGVSATDPFGGPLALARAGLTGTNRPAAAGARGQPGQRAADAASIARPERAREGDRPSLAFPISARRVLSPAHLWPTG